MTKQEWDMELSSAALALEAVTLTLRDLQFNNTDEESHDIADITTCKDCALVAFKDFSAYCSGPMCGVVKPWDYCSHAIRKET